MTKSLVVVESPAKAKTIEKFLGKNFTVRASMGHLRDLPKSQFGIDIEDHFKPKYINIRGKGDIIKSLKDAAKNSDKVYLASDPDREGEAIAWHLAHILNIPEDKACRIEFNEITKSAIQNAVKRPRPIDVARVDAQQARRLLDRLVGYKLSPLLWRKVRKGLSAGRVQSVAVRLICDRENEIQAFVPVEYWSITAKLRESAKAPLFEAQLITIDDKKVEISNEEQATKITEELKRTQYIVKEVKRRERRRNPAPPFTTSSLQQDASRKLGFTSRKTMMIAQQLYEGLDVGSRGPVGLITYMRTDSTRIAESAQQDARAYIEQKYGNDYLPGKSPVYTSKKSAQDAHEAIRPTDLSLAPDSIGKYLSKDQLKLYTLIWGRFIASQMNAAVYDTLTVDISADHYGLRATGSRLKFAGFMAVYTESRDDEEKEKDTNLPELTSGQLLRLSKLFPKQHFTEPPPRYTEASLVKVLEEKGIGRPSTYAPIIETILDRGYVLRVEKKFQPTELGFVVVDLLKQYFTNIVDVEFTAQMEGELDEIAEGHRSRIGLLNEFYEPFAKTLAHAEEEIGHVELPVEVSDVPCENCGKLMVVKQGRYGIFLACPGFPECRNTKPILKDTGAKCPKCGDSIVERRTKRGRIFYGCKGYPACDFVTWDMPLQETCPVCGTFMTKHRFKNGRVISQCGNEACTTREAETESAPKPKVASGGKIKKPAKAKADSQVKRMKQSTKRRKSSV
ncbi:DNA topoisomerase 1 [Propionispora sp. 2/2-37]|uniref:type I DNA topoisomerase n=1 Tax=Propionispora sp. 2/2-37 TaxID=1677858 RepID=UPI0006BB5D3C|nr:type I DNA topoisomerase [Propionispora sp. 2/2-37]CUH96074.1 DNA topoisomerase 1 [Propionispora sp. 2/2-37]